MVEENWLSRIRSGDESALQEVYSHYQSEFIAWMGKFYKLSPNEASEVYHITMFAFFENVKKGKLTRLDSELKTYIFGIGKNKAKELKRLYKMNSISLDAISMEPKADERSADVDNRNQFLLLKKGLDQLGDPCKSLLEAFYLDGFSMDKISETLKYKSASVAKTQKYKCIQRLKKIIANQ